MHLRWRLDELNGNDGPDSEQYGSHFDGPLTRENRGNEATQRDAHKNEVPCAMGMEKRGSQEIKLVSFIRRVIMPRMREQKRGKENERGENPASQI